MKKEVFILILLFAVFITPTTAFAQVTANQPTDLHVCYDTNDGHAIFDLTETEPEIIGEQDPTNLVVSYYLTQADAYNGINPIATSFAWINITNPQIIYVRLEDTTNGDFDTTSFVLLVLSNPQIITPTPLELCDENRDGREVFNLELAVPELLNGLNPAIYTITFYEDEALTITIANPTAYSNIPPSPQKIYIVVEDTNKGCQSQTELLLIVHLSPETIAVSDLIMIDVDGDGFTVFDLTSKTIELINGQSEVNITYFESNQDANNGVNVIVNPTSYINSTNPQTIYARLQNAKSCFNVAEFDLVADSSLNVEDNFINSLKLYPNPTSETINLKFNNLIEKISITIFNVLGQDLTNFERPLENGATSIDISELISGIYFIKIDSGEYSTIKKVVKN